jgi:RHS repeat-associated protein
MECSLTGFNGQRTDPVSGHSHLGNGYRAYTPVLGRFTVPDSWSPFGAGGINPYAYCAGDPVNRADPSGHFSLGQGIGIALGVLAGIGISFLTEGLALGPMLSLLANTVSDTIIGGVTEYAAQKIDGQRVNWGQIGIAAGVGVAVGLMNGIYTAGRAAARPLTKNDYFSITLGLDDEFRHPSILGITREHSIYPLELNEGMPEHIAYRFRDNAYGLRRLNIVAHRAEVNVEGARGRLQIGDGQYRAEDIYSLLLNQHVDLNDYDIIRFISCDSALDIAGDFAYITGKDTIGYRGPVTIQGRTSDFAHAAINEISQPHGRLNLKEMNRVFRQRYNTYAENMSAAERMNHNISFYHVAGEEEGFFPQAF